MYDSGFDVDSVIVVKHLGAKLGQDIALDNTRFSWYADLMQAGGCPSNEMLIIWNCIFLSIVIVPIIESENYTSMV